MPDIEDEKLQAGARAPAASSCQWLNAPLCQVPTCRRVVLAGSETEMVSIRPERLRAHTPPRLTSTFATFPPTQS